MSEPGMYVRQGGADQAASQPLHPYGTMRLNVQAHQYAAPSNTEGTQVSAITFLLFFLGYNTRCYPVNF